MSFSSAHLSKIATQAARRAHALVSGFHRRRPRLIDDELLLRDTAPGRDRAAHALIGGEALPALAALVAGTHASPSRRGLFALACTALALPPANGDESEQRRGRVALLLADAAARFTLLRELLAPDGLLCVHADGAARVLAARLLDELCGAAQRVAATAGAEDAAPLVYRVARPPERGEFERRAHHAAAAHARDDAVAAGPAALTHLLDTLPPDACIVLDNAFEALAACDAGARRWFACGADPAALIAARKALLARRGRAVLCQHLRLGPGRGRHTAREMAALVLTLFGADPLPLRRGRSAAMVGRRGDTFVLVDAPGAVTTQRTIDWALTHRARAGLAGAATVVLGWRYAPDVAVRWHARREPGLELRAIPAPLHAQLAHGADVRAWRGSTAFPGLGQMLLGTLRREREGAAERVHVRLHDYVLCARDAPAARNLAAVEFWSIDADFDGVLFRACWSAARGDHGAPLQTTAELVLPWQARARRIALRVVDVFGQATEIVHEVAAPAGLQLRENALRYRAVALATA